MCFASSPKTPDPVPAPLPPEEVRIALNEDEETPDKRRKTGVQSLMIPMNVNPTKGVGI